MKATLNIAGEVKLSFVWCILAFLHPKKKNANRVTNYQKYLRELNISGLKMPLHIKHIDKFERQNSQISVNVFRKDNTEIIPFRITERIDRKHHVNLLLLNNGKYLLVRNFNSLMYNKHTRGKQPVKYCYRCLSHFFSNTVYNQHMDVCRQIEAKVVCMPYNTSLKFEKIQYQLKRRFVCYLDFECYNIPEHRNLGEKTKIVTKQLPSGFSYLIYDCYENNFYSGPHVYRGPTPVEKFYEHIFEEAIYIADILQNEIKMETLTHKQERSFWNAEKCHLCRKNFTNDDLRVKNHCHYTGHYLGAAHSRCNLLFRNNPTIPIICHNLKGFDGHLLLANAGEWLKNRRVAIIPRTREHFISFSVDQFVFIDSLQFLPQSLESLVRDLDAFPLLEKLYPNDEETRRLLIRKGVFPYEHLTSPNNFSETELPPLSKFFSRLRGEGISEADYLHAQHVWKHFKMKTFGDYHDLYLKTDTILLAEVFENFRRQALQSYSIDPTYVFSSPGLTWQSGLYFTKVELELFSDINMYNVVELNIRGGVSCISKRYARANNPYMKEEYDSSQPISYLIDLDMNSLYGLAMMETLPIGKFRWLTSDEIATKLTLKKIKQLNPKGKYGYFIECDLTIPNELHDYMNDFPMAPQKMKVTKQMMSPYRQKMYNRSR